MKLSNVKLILWREVRDQLRDRRTMFMIFVLPILLYPLMGLSVVQVSQFMQEKPTRVLVSGAQRLEGLPRLLENQWFAPELFAKPEKAKLLELTFVGDEPYGPGQARSSQQNRREEARLAVESGTFEAALFFPDDYSERLEAFRKTLRRRPSEDSKDEKTPSVMPQPNVSFNTASEKSLITHDRLAEPLGRWMDKIREANMLAGGVPKSAAKPFKIEVVDVAEKTGLRGAATWAKILPILLVLWAMTGAFYPAVDLCAGEKERGTIETLLTSPATRSEIVVGKLLTIMAFSLATAAFNLVSVSVTGLALVSQFPRLGPPPIMALVWLPVALVPVSALFSALCLAMAAFARSTKEGQYYLMPLMMSIMPLVVLPMSPSMELTLGNSLIPITGLVLLLRTLIEGDVWQALPMAIPVAVVTIGCCLLAIRWAIDQFNSESVLFRENERLDLALWIKHTIRDRRPTPSVAAAVLCCSLILTVKYFLSFAGGSMTCFADIVRASALPILVAVLLPALLMTALFTRSPRQTLLLRMPKWRTIPAAILMAVALHPVVPLLSAGVTALYPIDKELFAKQMEPMQKIVAAAPLWQVLLVMALMPAICEELAFRGFILSGFRHMGRKWRAIVFSSLIFGFTHGVLQQSIVASLVGMILGYLAVQSGSIFPCMCFHFVHNGLAIAVSKLDLATVEKWSILKALLAPKEGGGVDYRWQVVVCGGLVAAGVLAWFSLAKVEESDEEKHNHALESNDHPSLRGHVSSAAETSSV